MVTDPLILGLRVVGEVDDGRVMLTDVGLAYQSAETPAAVYDQAYFDVYAGYEGTATSRRINDVRVGLLKRFAGRPALDVGIGSGEFLRRLMAENIPYLGTDVNPAGRAWLSDRGILAEPSGAGPRLGIRTVTMWDVIEHMTEPSSFVKGLGVDTLLLSLPIVEDFQSLATWKHYKPGEHLTYFTRNGLVWFMYELGYNLVYEGRPECECGREDIGSFVFKR